MDLVRRAILERLMNTLFVVEGEILAEVGTRLRDIPVVLEVGKAIGAVVEPDSQPHVGIRENSGTHRLHVPAVPIDDRGQKHKPTA